MFHILGQIPHTAAVAISGGSDSMAITDFLYNHGKRDLTLMFFHHGTETSAKAELFLKDYAADKKLPLSIGKLSRPKDKKESWEEYWRNERYQFFAQIAPTPLVMGHHLDDCVENWIFTSLHGLPRTIPYRNQHVIRPFLLTRKQELIDWCQRKNVPWQEDLSNQDVRFARNRIRANVIPELLKVNPGLHTVVSNQIELQYKEQEK